MKTDLDPLIEMIREAVHAHAVPEESGGYVRFTGRGRMTSDEYGCADAANIRYTIGDFERVPERRAAAVTRLQAFQDPETGLFSEETHHPLHATAHCLAALELFDAGALYPPVTLIEYLEPEVLKTFLSKLDWSGTPWSQSHQGAGLFAALALTGNAATAWRNVYFDWLDEHCDPEYGMSLKGAIQTGGADPARHLFGWFHYLFNYLYARRPFPHAPRLIDTCLRLYREHRMPEAFGRVPNFMEIDWIFALNRACRQTSWRFDEVHEVLRDFAIAYIPAMETYCKTSGFEDLHGLFGAVTALAELQLALPGELESSIPLKNVLDRRPFI